MLCSYLIQKELKKLMRIRLLVFGDVLTQGMILCYAMPCGSIKPLNMLS